ncbi:TauD/TfdA family dioxygenase [Streptomyces sp. NPDC056543]|uniref:TauD/TfdA family dioxygenase n=1 Tax=unclassified Streptomyces TaxID=2593676 RepID=UPI0036810C60
MRDIEARLCRNRGEHRTNGAPRHRWQQGGLVVWDNLATLHTASPCDSSRHRRLLSRAAVICSSGSLAEPARPSRRLRTTASAFRPTSLLPRPVTAEGSVHPPHADARSISGIRSD